jgi:aminoglycoside 3-N-acetyltransferase
MELTRQELVVGFRQLGLAAGHIVLAHSSLSSFGHVEGGARTVIDALLETVGPLGALMVPTLTGSSALNAQNPPVFDPDKTPPWTGRIPETLLSYPQARRSHHPTHSVAAIGARAAELVAGHEHCVTPCGADSPYARLAAWDGYVLLIGVDYERCTLFHHVEELVGAPYHIQPGFVAARLVLGEQVRTIHLMIHAYGNKRCFSRMEAPLKERGAQREAQIGNAHVRLISARELVRVTAQALQHDPTILLADELRGMDKRG